MQPDLSIHKNLANLYWQSLNLCQISSRTQRPFPAAVYISEINNPLQLKVPLLWHSGALGGSPGPLLCSSLWRAELWELEQPTPEPLLGVGWPWPWRESFHPRRYVQHLLPRMALCNHIRAMLTNYGLSGLSKFICRHSQVSGSRWKWPFGPRFPNYWQALSLLAGMFFIKYSVVLFIVHLVRLVTTPYCHECWTWH